MERIIQIIYGLGLIVIWVSSIVIGGMFLIQIPSAGNTTEFFIFLGYGVIIFVIGMVVHRVWRWLLRPESSLTPAAEIDIDIVVSSNRGDVLTHKDDMWWLAKTEKAIKGLDRNNPNFADNKWFFGEVFLFYTDRTMHHPNPGLPLSKRRLFELAPFDWKPLENITRSYVYPSSILEPDRFEAQKNNPYMHPLLAKYETMKDVDNEAYRSLFDKLNDAIGKYKTGDISYIDLYVIREAVYREMPEFSKQYAEMSITDLWTQLAIHLIRPLVESFPALKKL